MTEDEHLAEIEKIGALNDTLKRGMPRFSAAEADKAYEDWGCNCGPAALAAILGLTLDEAHVLIPDFDGKRYTNPTMMFKALEAARREYTGRTYKVDSATTEFPHYGLVRIQWNGPWTQPGVPMAARYRYTHWVGAQRSQWTMPDNVGIFDINCINNGTGWCALRDWEAVIVPVITEQYRRADGRWCITHAIEVEPQ